MNHTGCFLRCDVTSDSVHHFSTETFTLEALDVETNLLRVRAQVLVGERVLPVEQELVHLPEAPVQRCRFGGARRGHCMRMDLGQREAAERKPNATPQLLLDTLDRASLTRVRAFVVAVLKNQRSARRPRT